MSNLVLIEKPKQILLPDGTPYRRPEVHHRIKIGREYNLKPPEEINRMLREQFGTNQFGEPLYRIIWGWSRMAYFGGAFDVYSEDGQYWKGTQVGIFLGPKYDYLGLDKLERWILEKWCPPEAYGSPEDWAYQTTEIEGCENLEGIGPYPSRGEYELSVVIEERDRYTHVTREIAGFLCWTIEESRRQHERKKLERLQREQEEKQKAFRGMAGDIWDDARVAFNGVPNSTQANAPSPKPKGRILQFVN